MPLKEQISKQYSLISYEKDRRENGTLSIVEKREEHEIYKGVQYCKYRYRRGNMEDVWVYLAIVSSDAPATLAVSAAPLGTVKKVKRHADEFEGYVLCAINAGYFHFFNNGDLTPYGVQVIRGEERFPPGKDKPEFSCNWAGITKQGKIIFGDVDDYDNQWKNQLEYAVGGGARLIRNGEIFLPCDKGQHPRTAIGLATDGTWILMCADGRTPQSAGLTYGDMIDIYTGLGYEIAELLNLDGGGSTTFVLRNGDDRLTVQNVPSGPPLPISYQKYDLPLPVPFEDSQARGVADCLLIVATDLNKLL